MDDEDEIMDMPPPPPAPIPSPQGPSAAAAPAAVPGLIPTHQPPAPDSSDDEDDALPSALPPVPPPAAAAQGDKARLDAEEVALESMLAPAAVAAPAAAASSSPAASSSSSSAPPAAGTNNRANAGHAPKTLPSIESVRASGIPANINGAPLSSAAEQKRFDALNPKPTFEERTPQPPPRKLILEGPLGKKSPGMFTLWQNRYFILHSDKLEYFQDIKEAKGGGKPKGIVPLYAIKIVTNLGPTKGTPTRFDVITGDAATGRTFELRTQTPYECENWVLSIKEALKELERYGGTSVTGALAGTVGASGAAGDKTNKFWKDTQQIESILSAPIPVPLVSSAHQAAQKAEAAAPAAAASSSSSPAAAAQPATKPAAAGGAVTEPEMSEEAKAARAALLASERKKIEGDAAASSASPATSSPSKPKPTGPVSELPVKLQLVKLMLQGPLGAIYLAKERGKTSFFLMHVVRRHTPTAPSSPNQLALPSSSPASPSSAASDLDRAAVLFGRMSQLVCPYFPQQVYGGTTLDASFSVYSPAVRVQDSLLSFLALHRRIPEAIVKHIGAQLVCLLGYLHSAYGPSSSSSSPVSFTPLIARSLSPDNICFDGAGRVLFVDFFIALGSGGKKADLLREEGLIPEYVTPEVAALSNNGSVTVNNGTPAGDWWRLGVLLYELSVGIPPFRAAPQPRGAASAPGYDPMVARRSKAAEIGEKLVAYTKDPATLKFPPFVSPEFQELVRALLHPNPVQRLGGGFLDAEAVKGHSYWNGVDWVLLTRGETEAAATEEVKAWINERVLSTVPSTATVAASNPHASPEQLQHLCLSPPPQNWSLNNPSTTTYELTNNLTSIFGFCDGVEEVLMQMDSVPPAEVELTVQAHHTPATRSRTSIFGGSLSSNSSSSNNAPSSPPPPSAAVLRPVDLGTNGVRHARAPSVSQSVRSSALGGDDDDDDDEEDEDDYMDIESPFVEAKDSTASPASPTSPSDKDKKAPKSRIRGLVSKKKLRYQQDGFDLDLSYITPRVIAMGFPSEGREAVYRNPMDQVQKFFQQKHPGKFRIYNLCSERKYEHSKFEDRVCDIPFNDHNAPAFDLLMLFCRDAHAYLEADPENVIAIHCKAGKGRTGTIIAAYLLYESRCHTAEDSLRFFGTARTKNGAGVTIPSQRRYVAYFAEYLHRFRTAAGLSASIPLAPPPLTLRLKHIRFHTVPNFDVGGGCDPYFKIKGPPPAEEVLYNYKTEMNARGRKVQDCHDKTLRYIDLPLPDGDSLFANKGCLVSGDFKLCFIDEDKIGGDDPMFHCWLNTSFIDPATLHVVLTKLECDKANKDKKCVKFDKDFKVEFWFTQAVDAPLAGGSGEKDGMLVSVNLGGSIPPPPPPEVEKVGDEDDEDEEDEEDVMLPEGAAAPAAASSSASSPDKKGNKSVLRGLVSKKKLRYQQDGFDLDLSYITPRVIAMGFPAEGTEAVYRNPMDQVQKFFQQKHPGRFRVYNLCSERKYEHNKLEDSVCDIPFNDHNAPAFPLFMMFCRDAHKFLSQHPDNVIAVHCKAGKGRTGTMIAAFLLYEQHCIDADEALRFFGTARTKNGAGVTIPSQRRYVAYFGEFLSRYRHGMFLSASIPSSPPEAVALRLIKIVMHTIPNFDIGGGCDPYFKVKSGPPAEDLLYDYRQGLKKYNMKVQSCHDKTKKNIELFVPGEATKWKEGPCDPAGGCVVNGDFKICFLDEDTIGGDDAMFNCALNTAFIDPVSLTVELSKSQCDKAIKDKKCVKFDKDFKVQLFFVKVDL